MSFDPFKQKVKPVEEGFESWKELFVKPYDKNSADPYTKLRIILMNGTEFESSLSSPTTKIPPTRTPNSASS